MNIYRGKLFGGTFSIKTHILYTFTFLIFYIVSVSGPNEKTYFCKWAKK